MSTSRAKRKRKQRARSATAAPHRGDAQGGGPTSASRGSTAGDAKGGRAKGDGAPSRLDMRDGVARPQPIWAPFPLTEIGIAAGVIIFGAGFESNRPWLLTIAAVVLAVVVGELCLREHFAGFRSHAILLAALAVVALHTVVVLAVTDAYRGPVTLAVDLVLGGALAWWLRGRYRLAHERNRTA